MEDDVEQLRAEMTRLAALAGAAEAAMMTEDLAGVVTGWTQAAEDLFGWTAAEMIGRRAVEIVPPDVVDQMNAVIARVRAGETVRRLETVRLTKAGTRIDVSITLKPIRDPAGHVMGVVRVVNDLSQQMRADEEMLAAKEAAEEASRAKSRFLANVSHELRTPLNAIIGYSEMLSEHATDAGHSQYLTDLERIRNAGKQLLALISDVLDLSKIEAGRISVHLETFDIQEMLNDALGTLAPLVARNRNTLAIDCPADIGSMHADRTKVRQCLFNLIGNACKFTEGGTIRLTASREHSAGKDWVLFKVSDTGIGMSAEQIMRLFEAFAQAEAETARRFGGTGLGLTISRQFARAMGGDVTVNSELGEGSTFTLLLPTQAEAAGEISGTEGNECIPLDVYRADGDVEAKHGRVLVIDDDPAARELIARLLRNEGFEPVLADSGEEGLRIVRESAHPSVIVLDVVMPEMDGWSVLSALKLDAATEKIPVVVATVLEDRDIAWALGAAGYLMKPIDREQLSKVLSRYKKDE